MIKDDYGNGYGYMGIDVMVVRYLKCVTCTRIITITMLTAKN